MNLSIVWRGETSRGRFAFIVRPWLSFFFSLSLSLRRLLWYYNGLCSVCKRNFRYSRLLTLPRSTTLPVILHVLPVWLHHKCIFFFFAMAPWLCPIKEFVGRQWKCDELIISIGGHLGFELSSVSVWKENWFWTFRTLIITKVGHLKRFIENQVQTIQDGEDEEDGRHKTFFVQHQTHVGVQGLMSCCLCVKTQWCQLCLMCKQ